MDSTSMKIIVTHRGALVSKYGASATRVYKAVDRLIAADAKRGIASRLVALDDAGDMAPFGCAPMGGPRGDTEGAKRCIDAIDARLAPHYFLILGGPDVVPMQPLVNTAGYLRNADGCGDEDANIPSDLPYACDEGYSVEPDVFQGPTRAVGRLPDLPMAKSPALLVKLLDNAAAARPLPPERYARWFALSADVWRGSTRSTVRKIFGDDAGLILSPPQKDRWSAARLAARVHYFNCHGGNGDVEFLGQARPQRDGTEGDQTRAISTASLRGRVKPGTVVAAECCFGARIFSTLREEAADAPGVLPIPMVYLKQGAYGFFGSTTTAYGPSTGNGYADILCRRFVQRVLAGCSLGRAALEARIGYLKSTQFHDPVRLKTIAQFCLLGDPSIHPVAVGRSAVESLIEMTPAVRQRVARARGASRLRAKRDGERLQAARQTLVGVGKEPPVSVASDFWAEIERLGLRSKVVRLYEMKAAVLAAQHGDRSPGVARGVTQVVFLIEKAGEALGFDEPAQEVRPGAKASRKTRRAPARRFPSYGGVIAFVRDGKIVKTNLIVSR